LIAATREGPGTSCAASARESSGCRELI
jgi:hypothetical protein